ncbi:MAG: response regulator transcription factor [Verrucomicrobiae bacterium]|nr:response regulator transcription factor [Verrucomicrobiae bacterium]
MSIRVTVIEGDISTRASLVGMIRRSAELRLAGAYGTGEEALARWPADRPDVVVLDLNLCGMSGVEFIRVVRLRHRAIRVLAFAEFHDDQRVREAIGAGLDGYALKGAGYGPLAAGIFAVHRGEGFFPPMVACRLAELLRAPGMSDIGVPLPSMNPLPTVRAIEVSVLVEHRFNNGGHATSVDAESGAL